VLKFSELRRIMTGETARGADAREVEDELEPKTWSTARTREERVPEKFSTAITGLRE